MVNKLKNIKEMIKSSPALQNKDCFNEHQLQELCKAEGIDLKKFKPQKARELKSKKLKPREEYLGYLIQSQTIVNFNAPSGKCKTWLAMCICRAIATGGTCFNWKAPKPRVVVYLDAEMPEVDSQNRAHCFSTGIPEEEVLLFDQNFEFMNIDGCGQELPDLTTELGQKIVEHHTKHADVLVIDNFISVFPESDDQDVQRMKLFTKWLRSMRAKGLTIITINHTTKDLKRLGSVVLDTYNDITVDIRDPIVRKGQPNKDYLHMIFDKGRHLTSEQKETICFKFSIGDEGVNFWKVQPEI